MDEDETAIRERVALALRKLGMEGMYAADARAAQTAIDERNRGCGLAQTPWLRADAMGGRTNAMVAFVHPENPLHRVPVAGYHVILARTQCDAGDGPGNTSATGESYPFACALYLYINHPATQSGGTVGRVHGACIIQSSGDAQTSETLRTACCGRASRATLRIGMNTTDGIAT